MTLAADRERCIKVLEAIAPLHNLYRAGMNTLPDRGIEPWGDGVRVRLRMSLSTFDTDRLTRLVKAAHQHRCRVEIGPHSFHHIEITVHPRSETGELYSRHPGMEALS